MGNMPSMGDYSFYILMSFGLTAILMIGEVLLLGKQRKDALKNIMRLIRINARNK